MTTRVPSILIALEADHIALDQVLAAQGQGSGTFIQGRHVVAIGTSSPILARLAQDMSATPELEASWRAFALTGDLPEIAGVWGENGVISAADAQAATVGFKVHSVAQHPDVPIPPNWAENVLAYYGWEFEPEPEI